MSWREWGCLMLDLPTRSRRGGRMKSAGRDSAGGRESGPRPSRRPLTTAWTVPSPPPTRSRGRPSSLDFLAKARTSSAPPAAATSTSLITGWAWRLLRIRGSPRIPPASGFKMRRGAGMTVSLVHVLLPFSAIGRKARGFSPGMDRPPPQGRHWPNKGRTCIFRDGPTSCPFADQRPSPELPRGGTSSTS